MSKKKDDEIEGLRQELRRYTSWQPSDPGTKEAMEWAFLADLKTRLLEEKIIDGELSQNKEAQLKALRAFFDVITPVPPYKEREKIQGAIELLCRKIKSSKNKWLASRCLPAIPAWKGSRRTRRGRS